MAASQPVPGPTVSHYRIQEKLGGGGMGVVYKAEDTQLHRTVALKFLREDSAADPRAREQLRQEACTASSLNHANICTIYEVGEEAGAIFIAMEFVAGQSLAKLIQPQGLATESLLRYALQISSGLDHAHTHGVLHRDLKPLNIVVTPHGDAKILDFGLARRSDPGSFDAESLATLSQTETVHLAGTLPYLAPEQLEGLPASPRSDIWSFGITLYEMACGVRPYRGDTLWALCMSIARDAQPPLPASVPPGLASVIHRCLEKEPARRYHSAGEVHAALEALSSSTQTIVIANSRRPHPVVSRVLALGVPAALILAGYFALHSFVKRPPMPPKMLLGVLPTQNTSDAAELAYQTGLADTLNSRLGDIPVHDRFAVIPISEIREKHVTTIKAAQEQFGVNLVLVFSVQRAANQVRVNYGLVEVSSQQQLRSGTITASADDSFALQDRVFDSVASDLQLQFTPQERQPSARQGQVQPAAYDFYLQGRGYLQDYVRAENVDSAIELFGRALQRDPAFAAAHAGLGEAYWNKYQLTHSKNWADAAVASCQKASTLDSTLAAAHTCLGRLFLGTGRYQDALDQYNRAIQLEPASDLAQGGLALAYERLDRLADAEKTYRQAIALRPEYWATYNWLGLFYQRHARYDEAREMYSQVISLAPDSFTGFSNLGGICVLQGRYADAIPFLERSLAIRPSAIASSNLATAFFQMRRYPEAAARFEEAVKLDPSDYQMWGNLGDAYYWSAGNREQAREAYGKAISLGEEKLRVNPQDAETLGYVAMYHAMREERQPALDSLHAALRIAPKSPDLLLTAGILYQQLGDTARALDSLEKAVAAGVSPSALSDTPNFDNLRGNPRFRSLVQH